MNSKSNKYRVSIYLGKKGYEKLEPMATFLNMSVGQLCKILIDTGLALTENVNVGGAINEQSKK